MCNYSCFFTISFPFTIVFFVLYSLLTYPCSLRAFGSIFPPESSVPLCFDFIFFLSLSLLSLYLFLLLFFIVSLTFCSISEISVLSGAEILGFMFVHLGSIPDPYFVVNLIFICYFFTSTEFLRCHLNLPLVTIFYVHPNCLLWKLHTYLFGYRSRLPLKPVGLPGRLKHSFPLICLVFSLRVALSCRFTYILVSVPVWHSILLWLHVSCAFSALFRLPFWFALGFCGYFRTFSENSGLQSGFPPSSFRAVPSLFWLIPS